MCYPTDIFTDFKLNISKNNKKRKQKVGLAPPVFSYIRKKYILLRKYFYISTHVNKVFVETNMQFLTQFVLSIHNLCKQKKVKITSLNQLATVQNNRFQSHILHMCIITLVVCFPSALSLLLLAFSSRLTFQVVLFLI